MGLSISRLGFMIFSLAVWAENRNTKIKRMKLPKWDAQRYLEFGGTQNSSIQEGLARRTNASPFHTPYKMQVFGTLLYTRPLFRTGTWYLAIPLSGHLWSPLDTSQFRIILILISGVGFFPPSWLFFQLGIYCSLPSARCTMLPVYKLNWKKHCGGRSEKY